MAGRVTKSELEGLADSLNEITKGKYDFSIEWAYGSPRLVAQGGSADVSPRLTSKELAQWIHAFTNGYTLAKSRGG